LLFSLDICGYGNPTYLPMLNLYFIYNVSRFTRLIYIGYLILEYLPLSPFLIHNLKFDLIDFPIYRLLNMESIVSAPPIDAGEKNPAAITIIWIGGNQ